MCEKYIRVDTRYSGQVSSHAFPIPRTGGLSLVSDPGAESGLRWGAPEISVPSTPQTPIAPTPQPTPINVPATSQSLDTQFAAAISGALTASAPRARLATDGAVYTLHVDGIAGTMKMTDFNSAPFLPVGSRPFAPSHTIVSLDNGFAKTVGLAMIDVDGSLSVWPSLTKNNASWTSGSEVRVDSFAITFL